MTLYLGMWSDSGSCEWSDLCLHTQSKPPESCTRSATLAFPYEGVGLGTKVGVPLGVGQW
jgi:hypothetical protein